MSTLRRSTRQASREASRALSASPQPPPSVRSTRTATRSGKSTQPELVQRSTHTYGSTGLETAAQHLAAQQAMMQAVDTIGHRVEQAEPAEDLSEIQEDEEESENYRPRPYYVSGGNDTNTVTELIDIKTFNKEASSRRSRSSDMSRESSAEPLPHVDSRQPSLEPFEAHPRTFRSASFLSAPVWSASVRTIVEKIFWVFLVLVLLAGSTLSSYMFFRWSPMVKDLTPIVKDIKSLQHLSRAAADQIEGVRSQLNAVKYRVDNLGTSKPERRINWLAYGLGAIVDPYTTSPVAWLPVKVPRSRWNPRTQLASVLGWPWPLYTKRVPMGGHPTMALRPWGEPETCYCAPSARGKLQLAVLLPRPVSPTQLVIEHYARDDLPTAMSGAAPKELELWTSISNDALRGVVAREIVKSFPDIFVKKYTQHNRLLDSKQHLNSTWVPLGRWIYDLYAYQNVQEFQIPVNLVRMGVAVNEVAIRVNSNWGNFDRTCLARVRMFGKDQSGIEEYLEDREKWDEDGRPHRYATNTDLT